MTQKNYSLTLVALLLSTSMLLFSGCNTQKEQGFTDLNATDSTSLNESTAPSEIEESDIFELEKEKLGSFLARVASAPAISYQRTITPSPVATAENPYFTNPSRAKYYEKGNYYVIETRSTQGYLQRIIADGENAFWGNVDINHYASLTAEQFPSENLTHLANPGVVTMLSVGNEIIGDTTYLTFNVKEGDRLANWYFDEYGELLLRNYQLEDGTSVAVQYSNFTFDDIPDTFFKLDGFTQLEAMPTILEDGSVLGEVGAQPITSSSQSEASEESSLPAESSKESTSSSEASSSHSPIVIPNPIITPETLPPITSTPPHSVTTNPSGGSSSQGSTSSSDESATEKPILPSDYPIEVLPLPIDFVLTDVKLGSASTGSQITLYGTYNNSMSAISGFYEEKLKNSEGYKASDTHSREQGYLYTIYSGKLKGYSFNITLSQSLVTNKITVTIFVG